MRATQLSWFNPFLSPEGDASGSGKKKDDDGDDAHDAKILAQLERLTKQSGGSDGALRVLFDNNLQIRIKYQRARDRVKELEAKAPADGDVVLKGDDAKSWAAIAELKIPSGELAERLKKAGEAEQKLATYERNDVARQAAELLGYDADVLIDRVERDSLALVIETVTEKVDGEDVTTRIPRVRKAAEPTSALQDLDKYSEANWAKYQASLVKGDAPPTERRTNTKETSRAAPVTRSGEKRTPPGASEDQLLRDAQATGSYARF